jgi:hypothetical protein
MKVRKFSILYIFTSDTINNIAFKATIHQQPFKMYSLPQQHLKLILMFYMVLIHILTTATLQSFILF